MAVSHSPRRRGVMRRLGATVLGAAALAAVALPWAGPAAAEDPAPVVQTCRSDEVVEGDVHTSSMVVSLDVDAHSTAEGWSSCSVS